MSTLGKKLPPRGLTLTGLKYGRLRVMYKVPQKTKANCNRWKCICDCGKYCTVNSSNLIRGITKSCGCIQKFNLIGKKYGRLLVLKCLGTDKNNKKSPRMWECLCDCGNKKIVPSGSLRIGHTKSCGCLRKERATAAQTRNLINRTGQRYGRLVIIERMPKTYKNNGTRNYVKCKCDCGNIDIVWVSSLVSGRTTSCGCYAEACLMSRHSICLEPEDIPMEVANTRKVIGRIDRLVKEWIQ